MCMRRPHTKHDNASIKTPRAGHHLGSSHRLCRAEAMTDDVLHGA